MSWFLLAETTKLDVQMQHWMFATTLGTLAVVVAKWWADNHQTKKLSAKTEETKQELKDEIRENTQISKDAFSEANALNSKILLCQQNIATLQEQMMQVVERLDTKKKRIHDIANDVNSIKLALAVPEAPPIAGHEAKPQQEQP